MKLDLVIVDDSPLWLSVAEKLSKNHPDIKKVITFHDSLDAWIFLQENKPSLLMSDIEMPFMDGLSYLTMFGNKLSIISISTNKIYTDYAIELGCVDFLPKPFSKQDFNRALSDACKRVTLNKFSLTQA